MGGDKAPDEIVAGARQAADELGVAGRARRPARRPRRRPAASRSSPASEVIEMDDDPAPAVRRKKDSSLVRAAEAVRDGQASAMVSAGNTGATMASALLRMGRIKGVARPAIATPIPVPGRDAHGPARRRRQRRVPGRVAGAVRPDGRGLRPPALRHRPSPGSACCRSARRRPRATPLVKETHALLAATAPAGAASSATSRAATS